MSKSQKVNDDDAMSLLSTYMLQGWVMTDGRCRVPDCPVPIMRSKDGSLRFCVIHDPLPTGSSQSSQQQQQQQQLPSPCAPSSPPPAEQQRPASVDHAEELSANKMDEARLRREQSSRASKLIGEKLLQRWTLLNDICPNSSCYAIPLMRDLNKHVVCVICGQTYLTEEQAAAMGPAALPTPKKEEAPVKEEKPVAPAATEHQHRVQSVPSNTMRTTAYPDFADAIGQKLRELTDRMTVCQDPVELKQLFEAIGAGTSALKECVQLSKVIDI